MPCMSESPRIPCNKIHNVKNKTKDKNSICIAAIVSLDTETLGGRQTGVVKRWVFRWHLKMSIEWDSLILGGNELKTVGPATEKAC